MQIASSSFLFKHRNQGGLVTVVFKDKEQVPVRSWLAGWECQKPEWCLCITDVTELCLLRVNGKTPLLLYWSSVTLSFILMGTSGHICVWFCLPLLKELLLTKAFKVKNMLSYLRAGSTSCGMTKRGAFNSPASKMEPGCSSCHVAVFTHGCY